MTAASDRSRQLSALYASHRRHLERLVPRRVRAGGTIVEDACQTAWTILCARPDVGLDEQSVLRWLVTTATREAWKRARPAGARRSRPTRFSPPPTVRIDGSCPSPGATRSTRASL